jgi:uncharacterized protein YaiL (DUF2058 family)
MNERFRELREQAFDWVQYQLSTAGSDYPVMQAEQLEMINQKFAELIVRECANVAAEHDALDIYEEIREHFGVEE